MKWLTRRLPGSSLLLNVLFVLFLVTQLLDGVLTYVGIRSWGKGIEGNPIIVEVVSLCGLGIGVVLVKLGAVIAGTIVYWSYAKNPLLVLTTLFALTIIYLVVAIIPWIYVFVTVPS